MDPTKPILSIEGSNSGCFYRDVCAKPVEKVSFEDKYQQMEQERNFYKDQYQRLYQAYQSLKMKLQGLEQLKSYITQLQSKISDLEHQTRGGANSIQMRVLRQKNEQLSQTILCKNYELEDAYRRIQESVKRPAAQVPGINRKVLASVDKLQDGVKQAIFSNFELLKNNSIAELKSLIRDPTIETVSYASQLNRGGYSTAPAYTQSQAIGRNGNLGCQPSSLPRY